MISGPETSPSESVSKHSVVLIGAARLELDRLEAAAVLKDLAVLPGHHFEKLKGERKNRYSIRINEQWRICFEWNEGASGPSNVEIVDYH